MTAPITTNKLKFPSGYRQFPISATLPYFNNYKPGSPQVQLGATNELTIAAVPPDLSTLSFISPSGKLFVFQFVYNASVQTTGIKVPLPLSGASTAAQTLTALLAVLAAGSGIPLAGVSVAFPWVVIQTAANKLELSWTQAGTPQVELPANITNVLTAGSFSFSTSAPGIIGKMYCFLPVT